MKLLVQFFFTATLIKISTFLKCRIVSATVNEMRARLRFAITILMFFGTTLLLLRIVNMSQENSMHQRHARAAEFVVPVEPTEDNSLRLLTSSNETVHETIAVKQVLNQRH